MYQQFPNHSYHLDKRVWCFTPEWQNEKTKFDQKSDQKKN